MTIDDRLPVAKAGRALEAGGYPVSGVAETGRCSDLGRDVYITKPVIYQSLGYAIRQFGLLLSVIQIPEQIS